MKITIDGKEFELTKVWGGQPIREDEEVYALKPVKKSEKKEYMLVFDTVEKGGLLIDKSLDLSPTNTPIHIG